MQQASVSGSQLPFGHHPQYDEEEDEDEDEDEEEEDDDPHHSDRVACDFPPVGGSPPCFLVLLMAWCFLPLGAYLIPPPLGALLPPLILT